MTTCITHHNACDCREAEFAAMQRELSTERERADYAWRNTRAIEAHYTEADERQRAEIARLNLELQKRDKCAFIGPMRDCPTHGESAELNRLRGAWPIKGVRVDGDRVIIAVKGGNDAARWLCGEILSTHSATPDTPQSETVPRIELRGGVGDNMFEEFTG